MLNILLRTLIVYTLLVIAMRIGGKRQIGELQLSELVCALLLYDMDFLNVMIYNMFTILLIFMVVFRWKIWRMKKALQNE